MHVPGHNPFIEELIQDIMLEPYTSGGFLTDIPTYEYSGISPEIMGALENIFALDQTYQLPFAGSPGSFISNGVLNYYGLAPNIDESNPQFGAEAGTPELTIESGLPFINVFDPESLAAGLSSVLGLSPGSAGAIKAGEVKALTPEMIEKTTSEYYSPYEESERESLVEKLGTAMSKAQTGGFAGSGARQSGLSGAERLYRGGYGDILSDIMKMRGQATGDVLDTIYGYQELLDRIIPA